jgi:choline dehydrogenase-like flavoprotein
MSHASMPSCPAEHCCDVPVIGGGPAGSTAATLLAEKGHRVTLREKAHHPRFHIGESLLPANLPLFEKLGVRAEIEAIGMQKWEAEFVPPWHEHRQTFEFADAWDKSMPLAYQVRRSEFDEILIRNAARKGADVIEGCRVREVEFLPNDAGALVRAEHDDGRSETWQCRFLVYRITNPTMRDLFMSPRNNFRVREALLSVLAGDIFGKTPIRRSLLAFKTINYLTSLVNLRRTVTAWKRRKVNIRPLDDVEEAACR